jgi:hypothetical protein
MLIQGLFDTWNSSQVAHIAAEKAAVAGRDSAIARVLFHARKIQKCTRWLKYVMQDDLLGNALTNPW